MYERVEIYISGNPSYIKKYVEVGELLEKDIVFAECFGKQYKTPNKVRCLEIQENNYCFNCRNYYVVCV